MYVNGGRFIQQSLVINAYDKAYYLHTSFAKCFVCGDSEKGEQRRLREVTGSHPRALVEIGGLLCRGADQQQLRHKALAAGWDELRPLAGRCGGQWAAGSHQVRVWLVSRSPDG